MIKKKKYIILAIVATLIIALFIYMVIIIMPTPLKSIFEENWYMRLPSKLKQEAEICSPVDFHGDGLKYARYIDKHGDSNFYYDFIEDTDNFAQNLLKASLKEYFDKELISDEKYFDFDYEYRYKYLERHGFDWIVMIWIPQESKLLIMQVTS